MLRNIPVVLSALLVAAHFLRTGSMGLVLVCLLVPVLLFVRRAWAVTLVRVYLVLATLEWLRTLSNNVAERLAVGEPWLRMALILAAVAAFTAMSAWLVRVRADKADIEP